MNKAKFFFYGTLRRGGALHDWVGQLDGQFVTDAVVAGYDLYNVAWFPGIVPNPKGHVGGEIFEFADGAQALRTLDKVEGTDAGLYRREQLPDGTYIYIYNLDLPERAVKIASGVWKI